MRLGASRIWLGTWAIGGPGRRGGWGAQDPNVSRSTIERAVELGVEWIDTAPLYGRGRAESVVGDVLAARPAAARVATKCGWPWTGRRARPFAALTPASITAELDGSRARLGVDRIGLYQIHHPRLPEQLDAGWQQLGRLRDDGAIGAAGICNCTVAELARLRGLGAVDAVQVPFSLLRREAEADLLPYCREHGIPLLAASPLHSGVLTDRFTRERAARLPGDDWRRSHPDFTEPRLSGHLVFVEQMRSIAAGIPVAQLALGWVLAQPGVHAAILGARRPTQLDAALPSPPGLGAEVLSQLSQIAAPRSPPRSSAHESAPSR